MGDRFILPAMDPTEAAASLVRFAPRKPLVFPETDWRLIYTGGEQKADPGPEVTRITFVWGNRLLHLRCAKVPVQTALLNLEPGLDTSSLAPELAALCLEAAFLRTISIAEKFSKREIRVIDIRPDSGNGDSAYLNFSLVSGTDCWPARLSQADGGHDSLDAFLDLWPSEPRAMPGLPLPVAIRLGTTHLTAALLRSLCLDDILLFQTTRASGAMFVCADSRIARARKNAQGWVLDEKPKPAQSAEERAWIAVEDCYAPSRAETIEDRGDIPVLVSFDAARREIPFLEFTELSAGSVFNADSDFEDIIRISANGLTIGEGRQADINGNAGVRITRLFGNA